MVHNRLGNTNKINALEYLPRKSTCFIHFGAILSDMKSSSGCKLIYFLSRENEKRSPWSQIKMIMEGHIYVWIYGAKSQARIRNIKFHSLQKFKGNSILLHYAFILNVSSDT